MQQAIPSTPTVYLTGAGPGDPGLITVKAADLLRHADVIVYDFLANPELLALCPPGSEKIYVGKTAAQHTKTQDQINAILIAKAKEPHNKTIVRLKGGDPFVFGRGGEEAQALHAAGIPFEIVPGITAGIAAAAYAGIPVTHRDFASSITLVTGHEREDSNAGPRLNYEALAKLNGTLVFYMGVKTLPAIAEKLIAAGLDPATPAAVVQWGTHNQQQTAAATLHTIVAEVERAGITSPAVTIIGPVVSLRDTLNWFERRPLFGQRILVTRTRHQASDLAQRLTQLGAAVLEAPTIEIVPPASEEEWAPIDRILQQIPAYDWVVFTSANGVRAAWDRLSALTFDARHFGASHIAAVGPATARALNDIGITPDAVPERFAGDHLAAALQSHLGSTKVRGQRFLLLRADIARPALREELLKLGAIVEDVAIYQTRSPQSLPEEITAAIDAEKIDCVTFTSASTADNLWALLPEKSRAAIARTQRASIGPTTTAALNNLGQGEWRPTLESPAATLDALVQAITHAVAK